MHSSNRSRHLSFASFSLGLALFSTALDSQTCRADEHLFGFVRGAETLPRGHAELYQFLTLRTGKNAGTYYGFDSETEVEYGFTDKFQASASLINHYFYNRGVDELDDANHFRFGGVELAGKYRILSPFKDAVGLALRLQGGYLIHDEVGGLDQNELFFAPEMELQKNFLDDTLICALNLGTELAWGKQPAEQYDHELALQGGLGVSYRVARNWFVGVEGHVRSEYPMFRLYEHTAVFAGPSVHYSARRWWATLSWGYQVWGNEVDPVVSGKAFAEEARNEFRLKVGVNF